MEMEVWSSDLFGRASSTSSTIVQTTSSLGNSSPGPSYAIARPVSIQQGVLQLHHHRWMMDPGGGHYWFREKPRRRLLRLDHKSSSYCSMCLEKGAEQEEAGGVSDVTQQPQKRSSID